MNHWRNDAHELDARRRRMLTDGYRECDMPACNCGSWHRARPEVDELRDRIVELERDAARYRYLRERDLDTIDRGGVFAGLTPKNIVLNGDDLDAAIDAAMAAQ